MSFFMAMLGDADNDPFNEIPQFCDAGPQSLNTGFKNVTKNGTNLKYGPILSWVGAYYPDRIEITFNEPKPQSKVECRIYATIDKLTFTKDGDTIAAVRVGGVKMNKKIITQDA